jgi:hypothetical protein
MSIPDSDVSDPPRDSTEDAAQSTASAPEEQETQALPDTRQNEDIYHLIDPAILKSSMEMWQSPGLSIATGEQIDQPTQTQNDQEPRGIQRAQETTDTQHNPETSSQPFVKLEVSSPKPSLDQLPDEHFAQVPTQSIQDLAGCIQQDQSKALNTQENEDIPDVPIEPTNPKAPETNARRLDSICQREQCSNAISNIIKRHEEEIDGFVRRVEILERRNQFLEDTLRNVNVCISA